jgi:CheY-like chemotaxis protein
VTVQGAKLLVVATDVADATLVADMLREEFEQVTEVCNQDDALLAFEALRPAVLILAMRTLAEAERCYQGLLRRSGAAYAIAHRTVLLCQRADAFQAFELCRKQHFDDYVVFWPGHYDPYRLRMAALLAARAGPELGQNGPSPAEFAIHVNDIVGLEQLLREQMERGNERVSDVVHSIQQVESSMALALDGFSAQMQGDASSPASSEQAFRLGERLTKLRETGLLGPIDALHDVMRTMQEWVQTLSSEVASELEPVRALGELAARVAPIILVVDDDRFQHQLLRQMLSGEQLELCFAGSGAEALALLRTVKPELILLDFHLPDLDGVEIMRRLKETPSTSDIHIILMTGTSTRDVVARSHAAGAVDFMVKPFNTARLKAGIFKHIPRYRPS